MALAGLLWPLAVRDRVSAQPLASPVSRIESYSQVSDCFLVGYGRRGT